MTTLRRGTFVCLVGLLIAVSGWTMQVVRGQAAGRRPIAHAGLNQTASGIGAVVQLDGSGSSDPGGQTLTYLWTLIERPAGSLAALANANTVNPTFVPDKKGRYRAQLVVNNGARASNPDVVAITVRNTPPVANAGADRTGAVGQSVQLDGSASSDVDGDALSFRWSFVSRPRGSHAVFANPFVARPTFLVDRPGRYIARLAVKDGQARGIDSVFIDVPNTPPVANAGPDVTAAIGSRVTLDGSGSTDVDGDRLRYTWTLVSRPTGSAARLTRVRSIHPTFRVDVAGQYVVRLMVNDGVVDSAPDLVIVSTGNTAPVANAGPDQTALVTHTVHLDGSASSDVDGNPLSFAWAFESRPAGSTAALSDATVVNPTFVVDRRGTYRLRLIVNDGLVNSAPDIVAINVGNTAPVASAGPDQRINRGDTVTLDGSGSTDVDGDGLTYMWSLTSVPDGSTAALSNPAAVMPTFVADLPGEYVAQLIVSDGLVLSAPDTVNIATENLAPIANAGEDQTARVGHVVLLNGTASSDPDGDPLTFQWSFMSRPSGSAATLVGPQTSGPSFTPDVVGQYVVQLIVNDGELNSAPDTVAIDTINTPPVANAGPDQAGVLVGSQVVFDGSGSHDADGQPLTYQWSLLARPEGSAAALDDPTAVSPRLVADIAGDYVAQLIVSDGIVDSDPDTVLIRVAGPVLPVVTIEATDSAAAEAGSDPGVFTISRTGSTTGELTVQFSVDGEATSGSDYAAIESSVVIPAGASSASVTITPIDDPLDEGVETVDLALTANASYLVGTPGDAEIAIADNDRVVLTASADVANATESGPSPGRIRFSRTGDTSAALSFSVTRSGTAAESDYTGTPSGASFVVTIPAMQASADVTITPVKDNLAEASETVTLTIDPAPNYDVGSPGAATVTIADDPAVVTIVAADPNAAEASGDLGTFTFRRSGGDITTALTVQYTIGGTAANNVDYANIAASITIPADESAATRTIAPLPDNTVEPAETVVLTITESASYTAGESSTGTVTIADSPAVVEVAATDPIASEVGPDQGRFTFTRSGGDLSASLQIFAARSGSATEGSDYASIGGPALVITIPATQTSATVAIAPIPDALVEGDESVVLTINGNATYNVGPSASATVTIHDATAAPVVSVTAPDPAASEVGPDTGSFRFTRVGSRAAALTVTYTVGGTATNAADYNAVATSIVIPPGQASIDLAIVPVSDSTIEGSETVVVTVVDSPDYDPGAPVTATVTIADTVGDCGSDGPALINGATHCGTIANAGEVDEWTFSATAGDRLAVHIGEIVDHNDFRPWIRLTAPNGASLGDVAGIAATVISNVVAPVTGTYLVRVASFDSGFDGTGSYRISMAHTPGPITITAGDQGGPLVNGATHTGEILLGDVDAWTFNATAGDRIALHIGQIVDTADFRPWIRIWAPNGATLGDVAGVDATALSDIVAPVTGPYLVLVSSFDSGFDGAGTYRLTMTHTPVPIAVSPGDQGGPMTNAAIHTGEIVRGDLDVWTFDATAGDRIAIHIGKVADNDDFRPWIRVWGPNGQNLGDVAGVSSTALSGIVAPVSGTYLLLVATFDSGFDGSGTYRMTMEHTGAAVTVTPGDQGGPMVNGAIHTGEIVNGDLDVWTFDATAGDRIAIHIGEMVDNDDFRPWIRVWGPNGQNLGDVAGVSSTALSGIVAPVTGTYHLLVATFDSGFDGTGTYRMTITRTGAAITVSPGDQGGPMTNGAIHSGEIVNGDIDVWTFDATAGDRIAVHIGEMVDNDDFRPWIRVWGPNGQNLGDVAGVSSTALSGIVAPVTGTYHLLVATFDSGFDGTGTYRITMSRTGAPVTVSAGDEGGPLANGAIHIGEILQGDVDVWTFDATAGDRIGIHIGEILDTDDFRPWIRVWGPNGQNLGDVAGVEATALSGIVAPISGTYQVLVATFDSGFDGEGTYRLTMMHTPGPITVSAGDQGGPLGNGTTHAGEIVQGDVDVWTIFVVAGERISASLAQTSETDDFRPWLRIWGPAGANVADVAGVDATGVTNAIAAVSGTYLVLVSSFDSGFDGTGTYQLAVTHNPLP